MKIALDLDGVVYAWDKTARYMLRNRLARQRRPIPAELFAPSRHWDAIQHAVEPQDWDWLWDDAIEQGLYRYGHCERGAIEGVQELSTMGDLFVLTARPRRALPDTLDWINFMFNKSRICDIVFSEDKHDVEANVYVDDSPKTVQKLHDLGKRVILFRKPWNDYLPTSVGIHVPNWTGVVETVRGLQP